MSEIAYFLIIPALILASFFPSYRRWRLCRSCERRPYTVGWSQYCDSCHQRWQGHVEETERRNRIEGYKREMRERAQARAEFEAEEGWSYRG